MVLKAAVTLETPNIIGAFLAKRSSVNLIHCTEIPKEHSKGKHLNKTLIFGFNGFKLNLRKLPIISAV